MYINYDRPLLLSEKQCTFYLYVYGGRISQGVAQAMTLGDRIKKQRARRGFTQEELASKADVPRPRITELEMNRRTKVASDVLRRLARALGCTTDYLVGMNEDEQDSELLPTEQDLVPA